MPKSPYFPHQNFTRHAKKFPESLAIISDSQNMSFRDLDLSSNRLANLLKSNGIAKNKVVAIQLNRSPEMVVSVLAVYKAGGSCVFIDPSTPYLRLQKMMDVLRPKCVITKENYLENYRGEMKSLVLVDELDELLRCFSEVFSGVQIDPEDTAHIYFTSGSEGEPKAVAFPYGWQADCTFPEPMTERHVFKTDSGTTFTRAEIIRPLARGQQLYIAPSGLERDFRKLAEYIAKNSITHLICTPTALRELLVAEEVKNCHSLRSVTCSGERISPQLKREFFAKLNAELLISYGCTEVPGAVSYVMTKESDLARDVVGKVAPLMEAYVLNADLDPLPIGVEGEIYLGGLMAKEYLNNPMLTRNRFVANPFDPEGVSRLFKTGDRGCWVDDGFLQIKGRNDGLVKIRGFRVELAEVEAVISGLPFVRQVAVVPEANGSDVDSLMAFVAVNSDSISTGDIKTALHKMLPGYMVPARFFLTDELPLTSSGKIDRTSLNATAFEGGKSNSLSRDPNDHERQLISIWRSLLHIKKIDVQDNFFDLGGNSLLAAQMIDQVERFFGSSLPLDSLWFQGGTVESLAALLKQDFFERQTSSVVSIKEGRRTPLFVVHVRGGHLSDYYHLARCLAPEQAVYGLQARGIFGAERPDSTISGMAAHCIASMKKVQSTGPYMIVGYSSGGIVAYEMAQQLHSMGEDVSLLVLLDVFCPSTGSIGRWKKAFRRLRQGRTHDLRDAIYSLLMRVFKLENALKFYDLYSAHKWAVLNYRPDSTNKKAEFIVADNSIEKSGDRFLGWGKYVPDGCQITQFSGDHVDLMRYPLVIDVAKVLQNRIDDLR